MPPGDLEDRDTSPLVGLGRTGHNICTVGNKTRGKILLEQHKI